MGRRITLEEIARQSGVSLATVSLVLRDKPGINSETRRRVLDTARALGYHKKPSSETSGGEKLQQVGVIMRSRAGDPPRTNQFYAPVLTGIEAACRRYQINLLYATVPVDEDNHPVELPRMLQEDGLDGLLLIGAFVDTTIDRLMHRHAVPSVLIDAYAAENGYDSVITDNFRGAYEAVSYLIENGHRQIAVVGSMPNAYPSILDRRRGYLQALEDNGITQAYFADSHLVSIEAAEIVVKLLRRSPEITALFCCNDDVAIDVLQAVQSLGRHAPTDLSIIGFDDIELAAHVVPGLTTMQVDKISMGRLAVQMLLNRVEFPATSHVTTMLRPMLIKRQSVQPLVLESSMAKA